MKVTDLRRKLMAALAAGGVLAPSAAYAANLNTNLVTNPGFENVDLLTTGDYGAPLILDWIGAPPAPPALGYKGFAYSHDGSAGVPDYANGGPLAGGGSWYFTPNNDAEDINGVATVADIDGPSQFYQDIDVSTGASGTLIATGTAAFRVSAFFSGYFTNGDLGNVHLSFRNSSAVELSTAILTAVDPSAWMQNSTGGTIPVGTATVRVSLFGTPVTGGPDGYTDNVDFQVTDEIIKPVLELIVNRDSGGMTLSNRTGGPENMSGYQITSAIGSLVPAPANWKSITDNYDKGSPGLDQFDAAHDWSKLTDLATHGDLSEADLDLAGGGTGASFAHTETLSIGNAGAWIKNPTEDLDFQYISNGQIVQGIVTFEGNGGEPFAVGDFNIDGSISSLDWNILRTNQHTNLLSLSQLAAYALGDMTGDLQNNHPDFVAFKIAYDAFNGAGAFAAMVNSVPEPSSILLVLAAGLFVVPVSRRSTNRN